MGKRGAMSAGVRRSWMRVPCLRPPRRTSNIWTEPGRDQPEGAAVDRESGGEEMEFVAASGAANDISLAQPPTLKLLRMRRSARSSLTMR